MSFSNFDVTRRMRKGNFLNQVDQLIDWKLLEQAIAPHYAPTSDATGRTAYPDFLAIQNAFSKHMGLSGSSKELRKTKIE